MFQKCYNVYYRNVMFNVMLATEIHADEFSNTVVTNRYNVASCKQANLIIWGGKMRSPK